MASSKERRRRLERARYERVQAKQTAKRNRTRRVYQITGSVVALAVVAAGIVALAMTSGGSNTKHTAKTADSSPSPTPSASCAYTKQGTASRDVGVPTINPKTFKQSYTATITTNQGTITFTALGAQAPCATNSFSFLANKGYFNNTPCHRVTTSGIFVVQCGDPTGTGDGGPGYVFPSENLSGATYPAGTVAMANTGQPDSNGSQFFLVYKNGSSLSASYTPFGRITSGLDVLTKVAAKGVQGGGTDGKPASSLTIEHVTVKTG